MQPTSSLTNQKRYKPLVIGLIIVVILFVGYQLFNGMRFHVVGTSPPLGNVSASSLSLQVNFNKTLSKKDILVSPSPSVVSSYSVNGKTLTVYFSTPLDTSKKYTVIINSISDINGHQLKNIPLVFTPKNTPYNNLSTDQQKQLQQQQSAAAANQPPSFAGTDALISNGISIEQLQDFKQAISNFATSTKTSIKTVVINGNSITQPPPNPDNPSPTSSISFSVALDNIPYKATLQYSGLTSAELFLYNFQTGSLIYDSGLL